MDLFDVFCGCHLGRHLLGLAGLGRWACTVLCLFIYLFLILCLHIYIYIYILVISNIMNKSLFIQVEIAKNLLFIYINTRLKINK